MKKAIELLEDALDKISCVSGADRMEQKLARDGESLINEAVDLLRIPRWETPEQREKRTGEPWPDEMNCLTCTEWGKCLVHLDVINKELEPFPMVDRFGIHCDYYQQQFLTPEQYKARTGKEWPERCPVYIRDDGEWELEEYWRAIQFENDLARLDKDFGVTHTPLLVVCATEAGPPPDDWEPEE